jgi:Ca2+-binding RTX toxin-like protein
MAITITAFDANNDGVGLNYSAYLTKFDTTFVRDGFGYFSDNPMDMSGDEYAVSAGAGPLPIAKGQSVIIDSGSAGDVVYDFATHTLGGTVDAIQFGDGLTYKASTDDFTTKPDLEISGLGLTGSGPGNQVSNLVNDLMNGNVAQLNSHVNTSPVTFVGSTGKDTFIGFSGADWLRGNAGNDTLNGGAGNDTISGGVGNDYLAGAQGNDILAGNAGNDTFVFGPAFGQDRITDFTAGAGVGDVLRFSKSLFTDFQDVLDHTQTINGSAVIMFNGGNRVTLIGVEEADLHANDFLFV